MCIYQGGYASTVLDLYHLRARDLSGGILPTRRGGAGNKSLLVSTEDASGGAETSSTSISISTRDSGTAEKSAKESAAEDSETQGGELEGEVVALRSRKGWGDRSVNHLLAAVDRARVLDDHR